MKGNAGLSDERQRLVALRRYAVLDTAAEPVFDNLTALAAHLCATPIAILAFIDENRVWFKSRFGVSAEETSRDTSFCAHAILERDLFVVADATIDARFATNPCVTGPPGIRFYAAAPVITPAGDAIGALSVVDRVRRTLTSAQAHDLRVLSRQITAQLELRRRTLELEDHERLLTTIIESEPECVKLVGSNGTLLMMNRAGLQMIEAASLDDIPDGRVDLLVAEDHRDAFLALTRRVFGGQRGSLEFQIVGLKGGRRWLETSAVPLQDERGTVTALLGITRDITERKKADAALRKSENNYRTLFEQATEGIFVTDVEGRFLDVNPAGCRMSGYTRRELMALTIADTLVPENRPRLAAEIDRLAHADTVTTEWQAQRKDGTRFISEVTAKRLPDGRMQAFARDITDRKLAEAALRESESRLRRAVQAGRVGLWDWNLGTDRVYFSSEWKRQIGYRDDEIGDHINEWRRRVHADDVAGVFRGLQAFLISDAPEFEAEFRLRHKDGSYRRILTQASKLCGDNGQVAHIVGSHVDITERAELQAQFLQAQKMESVGRLAGGIAHDFNNLLTVINGLADLAISSIGDNDPLRPDLHEIRLAGDRAARLTRQLLALSRQQVLKPAVLNLSDLLAHMQEMLRRLIQEDIELVFALSRSLGSVKADPGQIEQVVLNLAVNARDAMPNGGRLMITTDNVELDRTFAAAHPSVVPGLHVTLIVSDTGVGMDETTRKRIFEPFFTTKEKGKGTGLGLSTVYGIVKQSGGTIWVSSAPGQGTTFALYFPRVSNMPEPARGAARTTPSTGTETILLVEDEPALRDLARRVLERAGYRMLLAASGEEAIERMEGNDDPIDLVVTDVVMTGMNGRELAERLKAMRPGMKVLFMSGHTDDAVLRHGLLQDATRLMTKPYTPAELKQRIREVLDA
jgi:two-component system cell cycle sensor histidine kinase/response regulator CckA